MKIKILTEVIGIPFFSKYEFFFNKVPFKAADGSLKSNMKEVKFVRTISIHL